MESVATDAANNDFYDGLFAENPNAFVFNSNTTPFADGTIRSLEAVFAVMPSQGTSEYALTIKGAYSSETDPPLSGGYRLQLGFGVGEHFVPAAQVIADLDFDAPMPSAPAIPASVSLFGLFPLLDLQTHAADTVDWTGHAFTGSFFHRNLFQLPLDVPDLPSSVRDFYQAGELPDDFPAAAQPFTVRGVFLPEPSARLLIALGSLAIGVKEWRRKRARQQGRMPR